MLYINNIDDCNFSLNGDAHAQTGLKVVDKKDFAAKAVEPVYNEVQGRVTVYNMNKDERLIDRKPVSQITLDSVVYATALEFVVAFNNLMKQCCCGGTTEATTTAAPTTTEAPTTTAEPTTTGRQVTTTEEITTTQA